MADRPTPHVEHLLADLRTHRDNVQALVSQFPAALKRWAEVEKGMAQHHIRMTDLLLGIYGDEKDAMARADAEKVLRLTEQLPDHQAAWKSLSRLAAEWDAAFRDLLDAQKRWLVGTMEAEADALDPSVISMLRPYQDEGQEPPPIFARPGVEEPHGH